MPGKLNLSMAGCSDTGLRRKHNEDHIGFDQESGVAVLADGMGGHQGGEVASRMAVDSVLAALREAADPSGPVTGPALLEKLTESISRGNSAIHQASMELEEQKGMGTTIVALVVQESGFYVGHVGDSRLYLFRDKSLERITRDHSLAQDLIDRGVYTEDQAKSANVGHIVTRALGTKAEVDVDTARHDMAGGDLLLLCSDGLTDMVGDWLIEETLRDLAHELEKAALKLVEHANRNGGKDNCSVILVRIEAGS